MDPSFRNDMGEGVPTVVQCVKSLTAAAWIAVEAQVQSSAQHSCSSDSFPGRGIFIFCGCSHKKEKKNGMTLGIAVGGWEINQEFGINIYTLLYIK